MMVLACGDCGSTDLHSSHNFKIDNSDTVRHYLGNVLYHSTEECRIPCVCVVGLQLVIVALESSVILHLYAKEHSLLQDVPCTS